MSSLSLAFIYIMGYINGRSRQELHWQSVIYKVTQVAIDKMASSSRHVDHIPMLEGV